MEQYISKFEVLASMDPHLPEEQFLGYFTEGHLEEIHQWAYIHQPFNQLRTIEVARDVKEALMGDWVIRGSTRPSSSGQGKGGSSQGPFFQLEG